MKPEWCPQKIWTAAVKIAWPIIWLHADAEQAGTEAIASALLDAHQRGRREGMEEAAEVVRQQVPTIPVDGPTDPVQEAEYFALGHALTAIRAKAQEVTE